MAKVPVPFVASCDTMVAKQERRSAMGNPSEKYYLGVDGGGTKTKFIVCRRAKAPESSGAFEKTGTTGDECPYGIVAGEYTSTGCHYLQIGFDGLQKLLREGIAGVCEAVQNNPAANAPAFSPPDIDAAFFGLAGYIDVAADDPKIEAAVRAAAEAFASDKRPEGIPFGLGNDCENALSGALAGKPGINIIAGTGSVGCGRDEAGSYARCGGWNYTLGGDEGSAYWIARNLLHEFQRQSDGRDEKTALYKAVAEALSLETDDALMTRIVKDWNSDRTKIATLSPLVSELAASGDPHAKAILAAAARELADYAIAVKGRLHFRATEEASSGNDGMIPVSGTGGVFNSGPDLTDELDRILHEHGMYFTQPIYTPDIGAVLLAMKI